MCFPINQSLMEEPESNSVVGEEDEQEQDAEEGPDAPAHHPSAPPDELFDVSTTVDPSYVISLIRKLIPTNVRNNSNSPGIDTGNDHNRGSNSNYMEESRVSLSRDQVPDSLNNGYENMDVADDVSKSGCQGGEDEDASHRSEWSSMPTEEEVWEEHGCVLWDLAASRTHAELMVQNLVLEVLLANLKVSQSARATEICLGIIGNLACHEDPMKHIVSTNGLIQSIVDQLFLDDTRCLSEACRLLTLGLQSAEYGTWAEAVHPEYILVRIIWIAENTLNPQLLEKCIELLLAVIESQQEVSCVLLPSLMKLSLPCILINLLDFEMSKLTAEREPERYTVLDVILRAIEALSVFDGHSQEISSNEKLFQLVCDLVKHPDKVEVANSCVTAAVLVSNILCDVPDLASEISQDLCFLQGLLDIFPFASNDLEARSALWSIFARLLIRVEENEMNLPSLHQYVLVLASKSDLIEDDLLDQRFEESKSLISSCPKSSARITALHRLISILSHWTASRSSLEGDDAAGEHAADVNIGRLLDCCRRHVETLQMVEP